MKTIGTPCWRQRAKVSIAMALESSPFCCRLDRKVRTVPGEPMAYIDVFFSPMLIGIMMTLLALTLRHVQKADASPA